MYSVGQEKERELSNLICIFHSGKLVDDAYLKSFLIKKKQYKHIVGGKVLRTKMYLERQMCLPLWRGTGGSDWRCSLF